MCWLWERKRIPLETNTELSLKVDELRKRIDTLRKQIEDGGYVRKTTQENTYSMGSWKEEKGNEVRVKNDSQDVEKEKRNKELDNIKAKLLRRKT